MTTKTRHLDVAFKIKEATAEGVLKGYGSVFNVVDSYREVVLPGAFAKTLAAHKEKGTMPAMLWQHNSREPIGVWTSMAEDGTGLIVEGQLAMNTARGKEAFELLKMGALRGLSIGFSVDTQDIKKDPDKNIWMLGAVDLWEVSVVTFPANEAANVEQVRSGIVTEALQNKRNLERFLRDAGLPRSAAVKLAAAWDEGDDQSDSDVSALIESAKRATQLITTKGSDHHV